MKIPVIFWSFGIIELSLSQFEKRIPLKPVLMDMSSVAPLLHINKLNQTESAIFVSLVCSLLPEDLYLDLFLLLLLLRCCFMSTVNI